MRAAAVRSLPELPRVQDPRFELKFDGWRCLAWVGRDGVELQSRQGRSVTRWFPDVCRALAVHIPAGTLLDGELLCWDAARGRTSFSHLQKRITAGRRLPSEIDANPAHLVLFDVLRDGRGRSLLNEPLQDRRRRLERLLRGAPPQLVLCPQTADPVEAQAWFSDMGVAGVEGLVVKSAASRYLPGQAGWVKVKARTSTELIVGGVTGTLDEPTALLVGRRDTEGVLRYLGQTHRLRAGTRRETGRLLRPMAFHGGQVPWRGVWR
jgi:ATP-dependent DNA ligase